MSIYLLTKKKTHISMRLGVNLSSSPPLREDSMPTAWQVGGYNGFLIKHPVLQIPQTPFDKGAS